MNAVLLSLRKELAEMINKSPDDVASDFDRVNKPILGHWESRDGGWHKFDSDGYFYAGGTLPSVKGVFQIMWGFVLKPHAIIMRFISINKVPKNVTVIQRVDLNGDVLTLTETNHNVSMTMYRVKTDTGHQPPAEPIPADLYTQFQTEPIQADLYAQFRNADLPEKFRIVKNPNIHGRKGCKT